MMNKSIPTILALPVLHCFPAGAMALDTSKDNSLCHDDRI